MVPARIPRIGFSNMIRMLRKPSSLARPPTAPDIMSMPTIRTAKPRRMEPISFLRPLLTNMIRQIPMTAKIGIQESGFNHLMMLRAAAPPLPKPDKPVNQEVTAVPTLAPMITPTACSSVMVPEFTKPTTITVVAEEDWITAVTPRPNRNPLTGLEVIFPKIVFRLEPALFFRASPITSIPYRKSDKPHKSDNTSKMLIVIILSYVIL